SPGTCATAAATIRAARSSARTSLSEPLCARPIGERAVATMYASVMVVSPSGRWGEWAGGSDERRVAGDLAADDEVVHVPGALERVHGLGVGEVPRDAGVEGDAVAAADLAAQRDGLAHAGGDEGLGHRGVCVSLRPGVLQLGDAHAHGEARGDVRER